MNEVSAAPTRADTSFTAAMACLEAGRFAEGRSALESVLEIEPDHHKALLLSIQLALHLGEFDQGVELARRAIARWPADGMLHVLLGRLHKGQGRLADAEASYRAAIALNPSLAEARVSLGIVLKAQGRLDEAIASYELALRQRPGFPEAQVNLANALRERGQTGKASRLYREAAAAAPELAEAQSAMAATMLLADNRKDAIAHYRRALEINPRQPRLQYVLGCLLVETGQPGALEAFRNAVHYQPVYPDAWGNLGLELCAAGRKREGIGCFERAVEQDPEHLEARINLAMSIGELGNSVEAERLMRAVVASHPESAVARQKLGVALMWSRKLEEAIAYLREAMQAEPGDPTHKVKLGMCLNGPGRQLEAVELMREALRADPEDHNGYSNLLLSLTYWDQATAGDVAREIGRRRFARPAGVPPAFPEDAGFRDPCRRLRIGYVSPDLHQHSVSYFFAPALAHRDPAAFEVFCYNNHAAEDAVSEALRADADHWLNTYGLTHEQLARRIREDRIDILVDLAGHTAHNRLLVFAQQPAPVQMTWLGFPTTVGIPAIAYRITDWQVDPVGYERHNSEIPLRLPGSYFCYRPGPSPAVAELPALGNGHITFGSFNALVKISDTAVAAWAAVLAAVPGSRLLIKTAALGEAATRERLRAAFAARGIEPARIDLLGWEPTTESHLAAYGRVDVALDSYPYNGATTTCEALWMGVPVVSLCGETHVSRMGRSILGAAGLGHLVARSEAEFVRIAAALAADPGGLAKLRSGLRERLGASALMDGAGFARSLESLYRRAWEHWCGVDGGHRD